MPGHVTKGIITRAASTTFGLDTPLALEKTVITARGPTHDAHRRPILERLLGFLGFFRAPPPIRDAQALADFIDQHAAFLMQKGIYEYSRARAGHYAKVLFRESGFQAAVEQSRWRAYPLGLAMVAELVEGVLRPHGADRNIQLNALSALV